MAVKIRRLILAAITCEMMLSSILLAQASDGSAHSSPQSQFEGAVFGGFGTHVNPLESVKSKIAASNEEWRVIGPKLENVHAARQIMDAKENEQRGTWGPGNRLVDAMAALRVARVST